MLARCLPITKGTCTSTCTSNTLLHVLYVTGFAKTRHVVKAREWRNAHF